MIIMSSYLYVHLPCVLATKWLMTDIKIWNLFPCLHRLDKKDKTPCANPRYTSFHLFTQTITIYIVQALLRLYTAIFRGTVSWPLYLYIHKMNFDVLWARNSYPQLEFKPCCWMEVSELCLQIWCNMAHRACTYPTIYFLI